MKNRGERTWDLQSTFQMLFKLNCMGRIFATITTAASPSYSFVSSQPRSETSRSNTNITASSTNLGITVVTTKETAVNGRYPVRSMLSTYLTLLRLEFAGGWAYKPSIFVLFQEGIIQACHGRLLTQSL
jgi:hypothetical protein